MGAINLTNGADWGHSLERGFAELELQSEEDVAGLARTISQGMRDGAPTMDAEERAHRMATAGTRAATRRTPGRSTIRFARGRDREGFYCDVGPNRGAFYLAFIEYGTRRLAARPFLRPAIERAISAWANSGSKV